MSLSLVVVIGVSTLCVYKYLRGLWYVNFTPGPRPMFSPLNPLGMVLPANPLNPSSKWTWIWRHTAYFKKTHDVIAFVPWFLGEPVYYTCSLDVMKQLLGAESRLHLEKPQDLTLARLWGHSVTSANGDIWRRHRRVVSPAFNNKTFSDVWRTVRSVYQEMRQFERWDSKEQVVFDEVNSFLLKFTFIIICRCGFGYTTAWASDSLTDEELPKALRIVSETLIPRIILPGWAYRLPFKSLHRMNNAWLTVASSVSDLIERRKTENLDSDNEDSSSDILNCLVTSWTSDDRHGLSERDVVSNMFSLMFAGHETTSSGLVTTLGYLALYPAEQEKAYEEINKAFSENDSSELIDASKLSFTLFCFWEAQRLCPSALFVPRQLTDDTFVDTLRPAQQRIQLKKGSLFMFDLIGILQNPDTFKDPEKFQPDRWKNVSEHDIGSFGYGPRACLGRKFSQTEALAFLSILLYEWRVETNVLPGESREHYEDRIMGDADLIGTSFSLKRVPLRLKRRKV